MKDQPDSNERIFDATDARQGEIILRPRKRRFVFIAGLVGLVVLLVLLRFLAPG